jgi:flagellar basal body rod protein FlgF
MGDGETTDAETPAKDPVDHFVAAAAAFVLENVDRLRNVSVGGDEVWRRTDGFSTALEAFERAETPAYVISPKDPLMYFAHEATFFVLANLDRLRRVTAGGVDVWQGTDELWAWFEAYERHKRRSLADLAEIVEAELTGDDDRPSPAK